MKIIILGAGQVGGTLAENLVGENNDITLIDTNIERLREDRRFNEKVQKMLDKLSNNRSKNTTNRKVLQILEQAGKDLYNLLD